VQEDRVLEALRVTEANLMDPDEHWRFSDWSACTCGHIYKGARILDPSLPRPEEAVGEPYVLANGCKLPRMAVTNPKVVDGLYEATLEAVCDANGLGSEGGYQTSAAIDSLAVAVSDATEEQVDEELADELVASGLLYLIYEVPNQGDLHEQQLRAAALKLVRRTIDVIEAGYEKDRQVVADQAD
jgi:hypothetical protein